ncbi:uncharacterized protein [Amphiura filiformis]|uniref:uncharacterized protein isoform X1 n=1 Tax=Amphiura filiformis TaxID=82378 RepID=UPI003B227519
MYKVLDMESIDRTIPLQRKWLTNVSNSGEPHQESFTVVNYNILADGYTPEQCFPYCPREYFKEFQRFPQIMRELDYHDADIVCLQEVGEEFHRTHLEPMLRNRGYQGLYSISPSRAIGVAIFVKTSRFELEKEELTDAFKVVEKELACYADFDADASLPAAHKEFIKPMLFCRLRCRKTGKFLNIGTFHLIYDRYKSIDLSTLQLSSAMRYIVEFAGGEDQPHIMCGDMNQEPHFPGYQFMQNGCLTDEDKDFFRRRVDQNRDKKKPCLVDQVPDLFSHESKHLKSSYKEIAGFEAPFTCHQDPSSQDAEECPIPPTKQAKMDDSATTEKLRPKSYRTEPENCGKEVFIAALDYIWYGSDRIQCDGVLEMIDESKIEQFHSNPNIVFPSDHLLMKAEFHFL